MDPPLNPPPALFPQPTAAPPFPNPTQPPVQNHPPYTEMIASAISALNEPDGSSKRAIAKYMEAQYMGLPPNHSALLAQHIKQLKTTGHLVMVKNSYKLPGPGSAPVAATNGVVSADPASSGPTKRRGRPTKTKPEFPQAAVAVPVFENSMNVNATPVFVPVDVGPVKGPGTTPTGTGRGRGRPPKQGGLKRGPGRPAKSGGGGRGRGRPKKVVVTTEAGSVGPPNGSGRPRGRPKKLAYVVNEGVAVGGAETVVAPPVDGGGALAKKIVATEAGSVGPPKGSGRPRGRPRKLVQVNEGVAGAEMAVAPPVDGGGASPVVLGKRRGRPSRAFSEAKKARAETVAQPKKPHKSSGRPVRKPRKNALPTPTQTPGSGSQLLMAYIDLKGKYDNLQSRIKQAASVIKPCLNNEGAFNALQELELLADGDLNQQLPVQPPQQLPVQPPQQLLVQPPQQFAVQPPQQFLVQPPQQFAVQMPKTEPHQPVMPQFQI